MLSLIFFDLGRVFRPFIRGGLRVADGLGQHLTQFSLRLRWFPCDRCAPVSHGRYMGMPERELNPIGDRKNQVGNRLPEGLPADNQRPLRNDFRIRRGHRAMTTWSEKRTYP